MSTRIGQSFAFVSFALFVLVAAGCSPGPTTRAFLGTKIGDRTVKATLDGLGDISSKNDQAVIKFSAGVIVVDKGSMTLNGQHLAELPEAAKDIQVEFAAGKLTVTTDGINVLSKDLPR